MTDTSRLTTGTDTPRFSVVEYDAPICDGGGTSYLVQDATDPATPATAVHFSDGGHAITRSRVLADSWADRLNAGVLRTWADNSARPAPATEPVPVVTAEDVAAHRSPEDFNDFEGVLTPEPTLAQRQAAGLRALADMIEANPHAAEWMDHTLGFSGINAHLAPDRSKPEQQADFARIARRHGAKTSKAIDDQFHNLVADFGAVKVKMLAYREEVCERVVTGTREVTEEVPDPEALAAVPTTTVIRVVEDVEWVCRPLLAADQNAPVSA